MEIDDVDYVDDVDADIDVDDVVYYDLSYPFYAFNSIRFY